MENTVNAQEISRPGLGIFTFERPVTRSVSRALENQVVGSLFTQIDTGIERPVDYLPTDFFNRCTARVFGHLNTQVKQREETLSTDNIITNASDGSLSFSKKLDRVLNMSEPLQHEVLLEGTVGGTGPRMIHNTAETEARGAEATAASPSDRMDRLGQMMAMMMQQNAVMGECMTEVRKMRTDMSHLSNRVADVEASMHSPPVPSQQPSTSTPDNHNRREIDRNPRGSSEEVAHAVRGSIRKKVDLDKWHLKFDGTSKSMTVESFVFRLERMRLQYQLSYEQLLTDFHCLVIGQALKWYWQIMEDHAEDSSFDYHALKSELLAQFRAVETDYEIIREIMERKQLPQESFDEFYADVHDLTFRLRKKIPESELVKIIKGNLKPYLANLTFATKIETLADLKHECKRAEKLIKESRTRTKAVNELEGCDRSWSEAYRPECEIEVEALGRGDRKQIGRHIHPSSSAPNRDSSRSSFTSFSPKPMAGNPISVNSSVSSVPNQVFCTSPFHLMLCFACGMPADYYIKNPAEAAKDSKCKSLFHMMKCFACGGDTSFCVFKQEAGNRALAEMAGHSVQHLEHPEK